MIDTKYIQYEDIFIKFLELVMCIDESRLVQVPREGDDFELNK